MVNTQELEQLLSKIKACSVCAAHLPLGPRPVATASTASKIIIIGQAPGTRVHKSGIPWDDPSGDRLRTWLGVGKEQFYDTRNFAIVPMGFCYPGKGKSGDLPPRKECAPLWHQQLLDKMPQVKLTLLIGQYAQAYYLGKEKKRTLTETVIHHAEYLPDFLPLPHPSPRNRYWLSKNSWFEKDIVPFLREQVMKKITT